MRHVGHTDLTPEEQVALDHYLESTRKRLIDALMARATRTRHGSPRPVHLTPRQAEIVACWSVGMTNPEIAKALHISPATVHSHSDHIHFRLGAHTQAHAVAIALAYGWIPALTHA